LKLHVGCEFFFGYVGSPIQKSPYD
jgi:hypothetical protein